MFHFAILSRPFRYKLEKKHKKKIKNVKNNLQKTTKRRNFAPEKKQKESFIRK